MIVMSLQLLLPLQGAHPLSILPRARALGYKLLPLRGVQPLYSAYQMESHGHTVAIHETPMRTRHIRCLVQFVCSFSRIARYTPSLTNKLTTKTASQSDKANL